MIRRSHLLVSLATLFVAACAAPGSSAEPPATVIGSELFELKAIGSKPGCVTCHSLQPGQVLVGPSLADIGDRAGSTVPGLGPSQYIRASILEPSSHIAYEATTDMPTGYGDLLSDEQVGAIVDYLLEESS